MKIAVADTVISSINWSADTTSNALCKDLDHFYALGFRKFECAANYPFCGIPQNFRHTEKMIQEWILQSGVSDMELYIRIGGVDNTMQSEAVNLSRSFLLMLVDDYIHKFGTNLKCMILENNQTSTIAELQDALISMKHYYFNGSFAIGINQSPKLNELINVLKDSGIVPVLFLNPELKLETTLIQNKNLSHIYIDARGISRNFGSEDNTLTEQMVLDRTLSKVKEYRNALSFTMNPGLVLPVQNAFMLDSIINN